MMKAILCTLLKHLNLRINRLAAYFSCIHKNSTKGWKKHTQMTMNIIVPVGSIRFLIFDETSKLTYCTTVGIGNYKRLTVFPGAWVAFKGLSSRNILLNVADFEHNLRHKCSSLHLSHISMYKYLISGSTGWLCIYIYF